MAALGAPHSRKPSRLQHGAGFVASGLIAMSVDMGLLALLTRVAGVSPYLARPGTIGLAMVAGWLCHRRLTFGLTTPLSLAEFGRYAAVASSASAVNYAMFSALLWIAPWLAPELAIVCATGVAMVVSYLGMRLAVFKTAGTGRGLE
jgi:putative flippase GtrA